MPIKNLKFRLPHVFNNTEDVRSRCSLDTFHLDSFVILSPEHFPMSLGNVSLGKNVNV